METEYPHTDSQVLEEEVAINGHAAESDTAEIVAQRRTSRISGRTTSTSGYVAVLSTSDDAANHCHETKADHLYAQPIGFSKEIEFGMLPSQHAAGEHPLHPRYVSLPRAVRSEASRMTRLSAETWFWELCGIFVSWTGVVSIFGLLLAYDGQSTPRLPYHITVGDCFSLQRRY
jgi:hypothetical protein